MKPRAAPYPSLLVTPIDGRTDRLNRLERILARLRETPPEQLTPALVREALIEGLSVLAEEIAMGA